MKKLLVLVLSLAMVLSLSACGNKETKKSDSDSSKKKFTVGFDAEYPPYGYMDSDTGEYTGFDLELAQAVCDMEGWELVKTPIEWASKDAELNNGNIDCIWNGFTINGKEDKYEWSDPYVNNQQVVVVAKDSGITKLADLKDKVVAVQVTTQPEKIFLQNKDKRIPPVRQVVTVDGGDILYSMLVNGRVDAIAGHREAIEQYAKDYGKDYRILEEPLLQSHIGVAFYKDDQRELVNKLSDALEDMENDGTLAKIASKYLSDVDYYLMAGDSSGN